MEVFVNSCVYSVRKMSALSQFGVKNIVVQVAMISLLFWLPLSTSSVYSFNISKIYEKYTSKCCVESTG